MKLGFMSVIINLDKKDFQKLKSIQRLFKWIITATHKRNLFKTKSFLFHRALL
jgi:hypothetical protein